MDLKASYESSHHDLYPRNRRLERGEQRQPMKGDLKRKITEYVSSAHAAVFHASCQLTINKIAERKARLVQAGMILSGQAVFEIAKIQGDHINTVVQARADALLDAYQLYGAEIDGAILAEVKSLQTTLIDDIATPEHSGLPPGVPGFEMFQQLLETNAGAVLKAISCHIEQRKTVPKISSNRPTRHITDSVDPRSGPKAR